MKVELNKVTISHSPLTDVIYAGTKEGDTWKHKTEVTNDFYKTLACILSKNDLIIQRSDGKLFVVSMTEKTVTAEI